MGVFNVLRIYRGFHRLRFIFTLLISPAIFATILDFDHILAFLWKIEDGRFLHLPSIYFLGGLLASIGGLQLLNTLRYRWFLMKKYLSPKKLSIFLILILTLSLLPFPVRADPVYTTIDITDPESWSPGIRVLAGAYTRGIPVHNSTAEYYELPINITTNGTCWIAEFQVPDGYMGLDVWAWNGTDWVLKNGATGYSLSVPYAWNFTDKINGSVYTTSIPADWGSGSFVVSTPSAGSLYRVQLRVGENAQLKIRIYYASVPAIAFDGKNDYIQVNDSTSLRMERPYFDFNVKIFESVPTFCGFFGKKPLNQYYGYQVRLASMQAQFTVSTTTTVKTAQLFVTLSNNVPYNIKGYYDLSRIYVSVNGTSTSLAHSDAIPYDSFPLSIGYCPSDTFAHAFRGILYHLTGGDGNFDSSIIITPQSWNGTHFVDLSGNGNHGTPYGNVQYKVYTGTGFKVTTHTVITVYDPAHFSPTITSLQGSLSVDGSTYTTSDLTPWTLNETAEYYEKTIYVQTNGTCWIGEFDIPNSYMGLDVWKWNGTAWVLMNGATGYSLSVPYLYDYRDKISGSQYTTAIPADWGSGSFIVGTPTSGTLYRVQLRVNENTQLKIRIYYSTEPAIGFDGTGDKIEIPDSDSLDIPNHLEINLTIKINRYHSGYTDRIIAKWTGIDDANWAIYIPGLGWSDDNFYAYSVLGFANVGGVWKLFAGEAWNFQYLTKYKVSIQYDDGYGAIYVDNVKRSEAYSTGYLATNERPVLIPTDGVLSMQLYNISIRNALVLNAASWNGTHFVDLSGNGNHGTPYGKVQYKVSVTSFEATVISTSTPISFTSALTPPSVPFNSTFTVTGTVLVSGQTPDITTWVRLGYPINSNGEVLLPLTLEFSGLDHTYTSTLYPNGTFTLQAFACDVPSINNQYTLTIVGSIHSVTPLTLTVPPPYDQKYGFTVISSKAQPDIVSWSEPGGRLVVTSYGTTYLEVPPQYTPVYMVINNRVVPFELSSYTITVKQDSDPYTFTLYFPSYYTTSQDTVYYALILLSLVLLVLPALLIINTREEFDLNNIPLFVTLAITVFLAVYLLSFVLSIL